MSLAESVEKAITAVPRFTLNDKSQDPLQNYNDKRNYMLK